MLSQEATKGHALLKSGYILWMKMTGIQEMRYILEERQREEPGAHLYGIPRAHPGQTRARGQKTLRQTSPRTKKD